MSAVPVQKPIILTRPKTQLRVEQGVRPVGLSRLAVNSVVFTVVALGFFLASSLAGQVMVEKARRDGIHAVERAREVAKEESVLRDQVQSMIRPSAIDAWAQSNGFVPPETLVADATPIDSSGGNGAHAEAVH